ncbi:MAG: hypothetical protein PHN91_03350 [Patescibacteria group bacterium]|nr:hypothetical protein [Patescibacteria group bacterium]MDD4466807.1 hypothetical protein [Patescibacteria group bacterium]
MSRLDTTLNALIACKAWAEKKQFNLICNDDAVSTMDYLVGVAISVIVLVAVFSLAPVIGSNIDASASVPPGSAWNATENTDMKTGAGIWTQFGGLIILVGLISLLSVAIWAIMRLRGGGGNEGGI